MVMQYYPRFLGKELGAEYLRVLAPDRELFKEFKEREKQLGDHDRAFLEVRYEERFQLSKEGLAQLKGLSDRARAEDVFLLCQCPVNQRCHADLLLLIARQCFQAPTQSLWHRYPVFESRVENARMDADDGVISF